jgi:anti-anti-sigma factor
VDRPKNQIDTSRQGEVLVFDVKGDVTRESGLIFREAYEEAKEEGVRRIVLKFDEKAYFNSEGIKVMIDLVSAAKDHDQQVAVTGLSSHFKKIFRMVGISKLAKVFDSLEEAVKTGDDSP